MRIVILTVSFILASCTGNLVKEDPVSSHNQVKLSGGWGWSEDQCKNNPMNISFSRDGNSMFHDSPKGMSLGEPDKVYQRSVYAIHSQSLGILSTSIENEDRKDASGNLVSWDLVIQNENAFCWHRTDWKAGSCTKSMIRCQ